MKYSELYFHDLWTVKHRNVRIPSHSHEILRKSNRKVSSPSKKSIRGNMASSDRTMNVWPSLILVISLFSLLIRSIIKLLRLYRQNENVFKRLLRVIAWPRLRISILVSLVSRTSTCRLNNKGFIRFIIYLSFETIFLLEGRKRNIDGLILNNFNHCSWNCQYLLRSSRYAFDFNFEKFFWYILHVLLDYQKRDREMLETV